MYSFCIVGTTDVLIYDDHWPAQERTEDKEFWGKGGQ
jgi:hypothetical protein